MVYLSFVRRRFDASTTLLRRLEWLTSIVVE
jgi:hypothetical protein